jgi:hypothetical protein
MLWSGAAVCSAETKTTGNVVFRCRGVVPVWDEFWNSAVKQAAKKKKEVSILTTLGRRTQYRT